MRTLMTALTLFMGLSFTALAASDADQMSWDEIFSNEELEIDMPTVRMTHGPVTTIDQLCLEGDRLRTKKQFTRYIPTRPDFPRSNDERSPRYRTEKFWGYASLTQTYTVCVPRDRERIGSDQQMRCAYEYEESYQVPLEYTGSEAIPVYKIRNYDRDNERRGRKLFSKDYYVPNC
ncbi:MAG: hypothetical protein QF441_01675 [Bacteriovoracaceae bacterium]|nr:hypothetical protein [Bacteriovoracaceae bacterium]